MRYWESNMIITNLILYILSFIAIWLGAGLIIQSVDKIARRLRISSFALSFFVLGLFTSIPEAAVSINAVINRTPEIFVGTFLGGTVVMFLFIIPLLAILGKGIKIHHDLDIKTLLFALGVIGAPAFFVIDHKITNLEGMLLVVFYVILFYVIQKKHGVLDHEKTEIFSVKRYSFLDLSKVAAGIGVVFISSQYIVRETVLFAELLHVPIFYVSLLVLSLGTNLPELSLAIRSILTGKKDIAFGDYLGSAAANSLLFGVFTIINDGEVLTTNNFVIMFLFIAFGLGLFYYFSQSKKDISRLEGVVLLCTYIVFVLYEINHSFM